MSWANKYRPVGLNHVLGQEFPLKVIRGALSKKDKPRSWFLWGSWGSGKTTLTRILAKSYTCLSPTPEGECCNACDQCRAIDRENSANYLEVDAASYNKVEDIKNLLEEALLTPTGGSRYRVLALDECHMLSQAAQARLLKTLEDGIAHTAFILITTDPHKILDTIRSRCIGLELTPVGYNSLTSHLEQVCVQEGVDFEKPALDLISQYSRGHVRDALTKVEEIALVGPVTRDLTKKYLSLEHDDKVLSILLHLDSVQEVLQQAEQLSRDTVPNVLWEVTKKIILKANLQYLGQGNDENIQKLLDRYGARIGPVSEWVLSNKISVFGVEDWMVVLSMLRDRLGVVRSQAQQSVGPHKLGTPKKHRKTTLPQEIPATPEEIKEIFASSLARPECTT